jgi:glycogen(starch) synthase
MRVLFITNLYPPSDLGGLEQRCKEVAEHLRQRGHDVKVLTSGPKLEADQREGVIRTLFLQADLNYYRPVSFFLKRPRQERSNAQELRKAINDFSPDVIIIWGMWNLSPTLPLLAEEWMPGRVAYYIASYWLLDDDIHQQYWKAPAARALAEMIKRPLRYLVLNHLYRENFHSKLKMDNAICCSEYVREKLKKAGVLPISSIVIYPGIDSEPLFNPNRDYRKNGILHLLYFGAVVQHKGVHTAIEAIGLLKKLGLSNSIELTILGGGHPEYKNQLQSLVNNLGLVDIVHFIDKVPRVEIPAWLQRFDIYLFTSIWPEPIAATVMEAMAAGMLVIGTEVGGQVEMLSNGQNALVFQPEDAKGLAEQITRVYNDQSLFIQLARTGQKTAIERFSLKHMVDEIEQHLQGIIDKN